MSEGASRAVSTLVVMVDELTRQFGTVSEVAVRNSNAIREMHCSNSRLEDHQMRAGQTRPDSVVSALLKRDQRSTPTATTGTQERTAAAAPVDPREDEQAAIPHQDLQRSTVLRDPQVLVGSVGTKGLR